MVENREEKNTPLHFTFYTMTGLVLVILRLPCLTCLLWLLIQNSELLKFLVNCLNIWELCKSINDLVSHVIPLKSVLLGMSTRKDLVPLHRTNSQWLQCSEVGWGRERERVGWGLCLTLGIIVCIRYIQLAQYRPAHSSTR